MFKTIAEGTAFDFIRKRRATYQKVFETPAGQEVLADLGKFCRANETCFAADPRVHAVAEGRREVFLRIQKHLNLTSQELYKILNGQTLQLATTEDDDT